LPLRESLLFGVGHDLTVDDDRLRQRSGMSLESAVAAGADEEELVVVAPADVDGVRSVIADEPRVAAVDPRDEELLSHRRVWRLSEERDLCAVRRSGVATNASTVVPQECDFNYKIERG
jgi:hypothetical protein